MNPWMRFLPAGSSPLTRGKHHEEAVDAYQDGLIPAHAGKTRPLAPAQSPSGAHPRSRGENGKADDNLRLAAGSSPLTRGKRGGALKVCDPHGLIPAHAGKTLFDVSTGKQRRAHPRSRGENTRRSALQSVAGGSSPLTRGKRRMGHANRRLAGLIPAHAGKTSRSSCRWCSTGAHPRSRGENRPGCPPRWTRQGSSPLTRGKRCLR